MSDWYKPSDKKEEEHFKTTDLFGVSEERLREIARMVEHIKIDSVNMSQIADALDLQNSGELCLKAFIFGTLVSENQIKSGLSGFLGKLGGE